MDGTGFGRPTELPLRPGQERERDVRRMSSGTVAQDQKCRRQTWKIALALLSICDLGRSEGVHDAEEPATSAPQSELVTSDQSRARHLQLEVSEVLHHDRVCQNFWLRFLGHPRLWKTKRFPKTCDQRISIATQISNDRWDRPWG